MTTASLPPHLKACVERILYPISSANGTYALFRSPRESKATRRPGSEPHVGPSRRENHCELLEALRIQDSTSYK